MSENNQQTQARRPKDELDTKVDAMLLHLKRIALLNKQEADEVLQIVQDAQKDSTKGVIACIVVLQVNAKYKVLRDQEKEMIMKATSGVTPS